MSLRRKLGTIHVLKSAIRVSVEWHQPDEFVTQYASLSDVKLHTIFNGAN